MQFSTAILSLAASAALASATNTVTFWTLDNVSRTIYFTGNPGSGPMEPVTVAGGSNHTVTFPENFVGNFYAVEEGHPNVPGMLGEVNFSGWEQLTYFDVSAIVNPNDKNNVKQMWPKGSTAPFSGCGNFPCNQAYYLPDDVQTRVTEGSELMCTLGSGSTGLSFLEVV